MPSLPFFKFDADNWLTGKIQLLTAEEKGIFIDLIARIWRENGTMKITPLLHRVLRVEEATLRQALATFTELQIIIENDGVLSVKFLDEQLTSRREYIEGQRENGRKSAEARRLPSTKQKAESRKKSKEITSSDVTKKVADAATDSAPQKGYPETVEEVIAIAGEPHCGKVMTQAQAEKYLAERKRFGWIDKYSRKIVDIHSDVKAWLLSEYPAKDSAIISQYKGSRRQSAENGEPDYDTNVNPERTRL